MALVLQALGRDEALDARGFGVRFLALGFGLDFATNDEFADLDGVVVSKCYLCFQKRYGRIKNPDCIFFDPE